MRYLKWRTAQVPANAHLFTLLSIPSRSAMSFPANYSTLTGIPVELLRRIYEDLPKATQVCLALVSKRTLSVFVGAYSSKALANLEFDVRLDVLLALERDNPRFVYCADCCRLRSARYEGVHDSASSWERAHATSCPRTFRGQHLVHEYEFQWQYPPSYQKRKALYDNLCNAWVLDPCGLIISFSTLHAIMHRYHGGQPFGLPINSLESSFFFERWLPLDDGNFHECNHWPLTRHSSERQPLTRARRREISEQSQLLPPITNISVRPRLKRPPVKGSDRDIYTLSDPCSPCWMRRSKWISPYQRIGPGIAPSVRLWPWQFKHVSDACVIDQELYIRRTHRVTCLIDAENEEGIQVQALYRFRLPICSHIRSFCSSEDTLHWMNDSPACDPGGNMVMVPELLCLREEQRAQHESLRSCAQCYTDYRISLDWGNHGRHSFELTTYHRLGPCQTVNERPWQSLLFRFEFDGPTRLEDYREFGLGAVYLRWRRAHGESGDLGGLIPHWSSPATDSASNPWLRDMLASARQRLSRSEYQKTLSSWYCGCRHACSEYGNCVLKKCIVSSGGSTVESVVRQA